LFVLAWAAGSVLAQSQGKEKEQGDRPADRAVSPTKPGEVARPDPNASSASAKKSLTAQDVQKNTQEKAKAVKERGQEGVQTREKAAKDQVAGKIAETKARGQEQQARAFEKQAQHETAKHMERQARLVRIRELAVQKGNTKMVEQVDQLIAKEKQLYERKLQRMQGRGPAGGMLPSMAGKGKEKADVAKPPEKPAETKPPAPGASNVGGPTAPAPEKPGEAAKPAGGGSNAPKPK